MLSKIKFRIKVLSNALSNFSASITNALKLNSDSQEVLYINDTSHMPPTGRGFFSFVLEVLYLISVNGEKNIFVDYRNTIYNNSPDENMWGYCFEPIVNDPKSKKIYRYLFFIEAFRNVYADQSKKYRQLFYQVIKDRIRIKKTILDKTEKFYDEHMRGDRCLGVQYRAALDTARMDAGNTRRPDPYFSKYSLENYFKKIDVLLAEKHFTKIFLATDNPDSLESFRKRYGDKIVVYSTQHKVTVAGIRFMKTDNRRILAEEVMIDCLLLSKCGYLIHGASNISTVAKYFNKFLPAENVDIKPVTLIRKMLFKILYL